MSFFKWLEELDFGVFSTSSITADGIVSKYCFKVLGRTWPEDRMLPENDTGEQKIYTTHGEGKHWETLEICMG